MKIIASRLFILGALFLLAPVVSAQTCIVDALTGAVSGSVPCNIAGPTFAGRIGATTGVANGAPTQNGVQITTDPAITIGLNSAIFGPNTAHNQFAR